MSEATVAQGVAETDQGDILEGGLYVRDVKGMGLSTLELADTSTAFREGNKMAKCPEFVFVYL